jgi:dolichol kinase
MVMQSLESPLSAELAPLASAPPPPTVAPSRPTNYARNLFHVACGTVAFTSINLLPGRSWLLAIAGSFAGWAWSMEILRRQSPRLNDRLMRAFGKVAHPHEWYRVNSATWYATALVILALGAPLPAAAVAVLVLALGDPAAAIVGKRIGRVRLVANRSLEGTLAFVVVGTAAALVALSVTNPVTLPLGPRLLVALSAGVAGALTELFSGKLDDNFTIPVAVATAAGIGLFVAG